MKFVPQPLPAGRADITSAAVWMPPRKMSQPGTTGLLDPRPLRASSSRAGPAPATLEVEPPGRPKQRAKQA